MIVLYKSYVEDVMIILVIFNNVLNWNIVYLVRVIGVVLKMVEMIGLVMLVNKYINLESKNYFLFKMRRKWYFIFFIEK